MDDLYAVCDGIIEKRRAEGKAAQGEDLLTLLSQAESAEDGTLDASEIRDQVLVFLLAGHDTTATSLAFALHLLARHPEQQARAREEVVRVLNGRTPGAADLEALPYLTQVLKEALRLYPPGPVIGRRAVAATEIGGHTIPAGADVIVAPWVTHRHPRYWDDPERFDRNGSRRSGRTGGRGMRGSRSAADRERASASTSRCWSRCWRWR